MLERPKPDTGCAKLTPSGQKWKHRHDTLLCDGELVGFADGDWRWMLPSAGKILRRLCFLAVSFSDNLSCLHSVFPQCDFLKTFFFSPKIQKCHVNILCTDFSFLRSPSCVNVFKLSCFSLLLPFFFLKSS